MQSAAGIASIAGLPRSNAMVWVGPPLLARPASIGLVLFWLPVALNPHVVSSEASYPSRW